MRAFRSAAKQKGTPRRALWEPGCEAGSALRVLERAPRLRLAVLLALDHAAVRGGDPAALERAAQVRLEVGERLGDAVAHRAGLTRKPAARDRAGHVVLAGAVGGDDRLLDQHAQHRTGEIGLDHARVDDDLARAGLDPDARHRVLALAGGVGAALLVELLG